MLVIVEKIMNPKDKIVTPIKKYILRNYRVLSGLIIVIIIVSLIEPKFFTVSNLVNLFKANSVNAIIASGMLMAILLGQIDISVGSTVGLAGISCAYFITNLNMNPFVSVILSILIGAVIGLINGVSIAYLNVPAFVATLSTMSIGRGLAQIISGGITIRVTEPSFLKLSGSNIGGISIIILYAVIIMTVTHLILNRTRFGYNIYSIGGNRTASLYSGIDVKKNNLIPYILIGILSAFAGVIWTSRLGSAASTLGNAFEMDAIAAVVVGGTSMSGGSGTLGGTLIGVLILGVITNGLNLIGISGFWQSVFKGIIILLAVIFDANKSMKKD